MVRTHRIWHFTPVATRTRAVRLLPLGILLAAVVAVPVFSVSPSGLPRLQRLEKDRLVAETERSRLTGDIAHLRERAARLKSDPRAVESVARDRFGLVRPNEVVFVFKD